MWMIVLLWSNGIQRILELILRDWFSCGTRQLSFTVLEKIIYFTTLIYQRSPCPGIISIQTGTVGYRSVCTSCRSSLILSRLTQSFFHIVCRYRAIQHYQYSVFKPPPHLLESYSTLSGQLKDFQLSSPQPNSPISVHLDILGYRMEQPSSSLPKMES
jgi:hypothetical protein